MSKTNTSNYLRSAACILLTLMLAACGDSATDADETPSPQVAVKDGSSQTVELSSEPINLAEAGAPLTGKSPSVPICPWLSDASANAAVDVVMTDGPMVRRSVTANQCKWNVNAGFVFTIRSAPLADARSPSEIRYNLDVPPVLAPQDGPGSEAVVVLDPTWDAEKPRPFGFAFNADNRQFIITATGLRTSIDRLRAVADEIAAALPTATAVAETKAAEPTLDPCVYNGAALVTLLNGKADYELTQKAHMPSSNCTYNGSVGEWRVELSINFSGDPLDPPNNMDPEYALIDGFGADVYMKDVSRTAGYMSTARFYKIARPSGQIAVYLKVHEESFPVDAAEQIVKNLIARTN